jgi:hypothetical protein
MVVYLTAYNYSIAQSNDFKLRDSLIFISNRKIKHTIVLASCDTCSPITTKGWRIVVEMTEKEEEVARKLKKKEWMALLNDSKKDWAANLILYYIFDKEAGLLYRHDKRKFWIGYLKQIDVKFWEEQLFVD